jgi:hypothetical protein
MVKGQLRSLIWNVIKVRLTARWVVMAFTLLVTIGRFGLTRLTSPGSAARINVIQSWQYGVAFLVLLVALYWTLDARRVTMAGFATSVCGFALYVVQAFDVWPVFPSEAYYALMALILLADGAVIWRGLRRAHR